MVPGKQNRLIWQIIFAAFLVAFVFLSGCTSQTSQVKETPAKIFKIGILTASDQQIPSFEGFKEKMADLGYQEGRDVEYIFENPKGDRNLTRKLAEDLIGKNLDIYVPFSTTAAKAMQDAQKGTSARIVFGDVGNYAELGLESLRNPGKNITGVTSGKLDLSEKRMELLKELVPSAKTFAINVDPTSVSYDRIKQVNSEAAQRLGITLVVIEEKTQEDVLAAVKAKVKRGKVDGFTIASQAAFSSQVDVISSYLKQEKIPSIDNDLENGVSSSFLMAYSPSRKEMGIQTAMIVDKVLKGAQIDTIPVEFPLTVELQINATLANEMGIELPKGLLNQATLIK